jgi:hypothetical protein
MHIKYESENLEGRNRLRDWSIKEIINIVFKHPAAVVEHFTYINAK